MNAVMRAQGTRLRSTVYRGDDSFALCLPSGIVLLCVHVYCLGRPDRVYHFPRLNIWCCEINVCGVHLHYQYVLQHKR